MDRDLQEYFRGIAENRLLIKQCTACRLYLHPRRMLCSNCGGYGLEWVAASGDAEIYSFSVLDNYAVRPEFKASLPYCVGIVRLAEGVHLLTRLFGDDPGRFRVGAPVRVDFRVLELGMRLPVFVLA